MNRIVKWLTGIILIFLIGFGIYVFFIDCEKLTSEIDRKFTLSEMDQVVVDKSVLVKLIKIKDKTCKEENCEREGQYELKLFVMKYPESAYFKIGKFRIKYWKLANIRGTTITLGTLSEPIKEIEKLGYIIEYIDMKEDKVTFKLTKVKEKENANL